jgi:adenylate cyclase
MFIDIAGFTGLSERMGDRVVPLLSRYLDITSEVIVANGGTIDKFIGDAVMAFWGAPQPQADHALSCCRAALACRKAIAESGLADDLGRPLHIRIGINSGQMLVGNIGSELRLNYTVIGDAVNVASRLESANKIYGTQILIGEETERLARGMILTREIDRVAVYGREEGLSAFQLIDLAGAHDSGRRERWILSYEQGLAKYRDRDPVGAAAEFEAVLRERPQDLAARVLLERCENVQERLPDDWHPIAALKSK